MTNTQTNEATSFRFLSLVEHGRGKYFCDQCERAALYIKTGADGFAIKACDIHGRLGA